MFLNDVHKKEEIRSLALQDLRDLGIKYRLKKPRPLVQETKTRKVFHVPLQFLPMHTVTLTSGQQLVVPQLVHEMCSYILSKVYTEGLFRKGGSKSRQNEIKLALDAGCHLGDDHHEIDVASVLKTFLRELPEPLFPFAYHDLLLRCIILPKDNVRAILLTCLLLPDNHLNTLTYLMQFLYQVTQFSAYNKMDSYNLAVVMVPTLLPVEEKVGPQTTHRVNKFCEIFKLLVENAGSIGLVPDDIIGRIALSCSTTSLNDDDGSNKKKKKRSGSLTRMFNGLKKIVTSKSVEENGGGNLPVTPDLLLTPCLTRSAKKRKFDGAGLSLKKKKEIVNKLPECAVLNTPLRTPVNNDPNPRIFTTPDTKHKPQLKQETVKERKSQWLLKPKTKQTKTDETSSVSSSRTSLGAKSMLERRWSQVSHAAGFRRNKKRNSCGASLAKEKNRSDDNIASNAVENIIAETCELKSTPEPDYVKISRAEYEEIKCRVSEIERRISIELNEPNVDPIGDVQCAYEQTLEQSVPLSPATDHLARRLSRELKIRRSAEQKVIRSPSARKIGSIRRRSSERVSTKLTRVQSRNVAKVNTPPATNLRRGKPVTRSPTVARSSSLHGGTPPRCSGDRRSDNWTNAENFFTSAENSTSAFGDADKCRSSLVRLRNQNAGMVLAKAKLFNDLIDSDGGKAETPNLIPRVRTTKLGAARSNDHRQTSRVRALKAEERRMKKSVSPRRRVARSPNDVQARQRLNAARASAVALMLEEGGVVNKENKLKRSRIAPVKAKGSPLRDANFVDVSAATRKRSPCVTTPHIKRALNVKSPKRLNCRTPLNDRTTPLKVLVNVRQQY